MLALDTGPHALVWGTLANLAVKASSGCRWCVFAKVAVLAVGLGRAGSAPSSVLASDASSTGAAKRPEVAGVARAVG